MKMLAVNTNRFGWVWVERRDPKTNSVVTTTCKGHSLGTEDLQYFCNQFPELQFMGRRNLLAIKHKELS